MIKTKIRNNLFLILFVVIMTILSLLRIMSSLFVPSSAWDGSSAASFNSGTGSANNPYVISTEEELSYFNDLLGSGITFEGMYLSLGNDLDMTGSTWEGKTTEFKGNFNGNGHTITLNSVFINTIGVEGSVSLLNIKRTISLSSEILCITNKGTIEGCIIDGIVDVDETTSGLVCYTNSGDTARILSGLGAGCPILAVTDNKRTFRQLALAWNVHPVFVEAKENTDETVKAGIEKLKAKGILEKGDKIILAGGHSFIDGVKLSKIVGGYVEL